MPSPLANLQSQIAAGFKGQLFPGVVKRRVHSSGVDGLGDAIPSSLTTYAFTLGIREAFSAFYKQTHGIPDKDVKFLVLLGSIDVEPLQDDYIKLDRETQWYQVRQVMEKDPADASIILSCTPCKEPS